MQQGKNNISRNTPSSKRKYNSGFSSTVVFLILLCIFFSSFFGILNNFQLHRSNISNPAVPLQQQLPEILSSSENLTSDSMQVVVGNAIYSDLIQNSQFTTTDNWSFTNNTNLTSQWSSSNENAWIYHESPETSIEIRDNQTNYADEVNVITYTNTVGTLSDTYEKDSISFQILEGGTPGAYGIDAEFIFKTTLYNISLIQINTYAHLSDGSDPFSWQIYDYTDSQWISLSDINSISDTWYNQTKLQQMNETRYVAMNGTLKLRIYDFDGVDTSRTRVYFDYIEVTITGRPPKQFSQMASINQTFIKDFDTESVYQGVPKLLLNFSYQIEALLNIESLQLRVIIWNSTQLLGTIWTSNPSSILPFTNTSIDVSSYLSRSDTYNIFFEVNLQLSTSLEANLSVRFDNVYLIAQNSSGLQKLIAFKDNRSLSLNPGADGLDIRFQFIIQEGNLSISLFYQTEIPVTIWLYNYSSSSWDNLSSFNSPIYAWLNISNMPNFDYVGEGTQVLILRYTNSTNLVSGDLLIDYQILAREDYTSELVHIQTNPLNAKSGEFVRSQVNFTSISINKFIEGATIFTNYTEDEYIFQELQNGLYNVTFSTDLALPGQKLILITAVREGFENASIVISFNLTGFASQLRLTSGFIETEGLFWVNPAPYPDDQTKKIQIYFNGSYGGISGANIQARINTSGKLLLYQDLGKIVGFEFDGYYNITLDTEDFHAGEFGRIDIIAIKEGYLAAYINITFQIRKIPSELLLLEADSDNYSIYEGETLRIGASLRDLFHDRVLFSNPSEGNLTWRINTPDANTSTLMNKLLTVYIADIPLPFYNITPGNYNITIEITNPTDYEPVSKNIPLEILPKINVTLKFSNLAQTVQVGQNLTVNIDLNFINGTGLKNTIVELTLDYKGISQKIETETVVTNLNGTILYRIAEIPNNFNNLTITARYYGSDKIRESTEIRIIQILPKDETEIIFIELPKDIMRGSTVVIKAKLQTLSGTPLAGQVLEFLITYEVNGETLEFDAYTDSEGIARIEFEFDQKETSVIISVSFGGASTVQSTANETSISGITLLTLLSRTLPYWLIGITAAIVGVFAYDMQYRRPRKRQKSEQLQQISDRFHDAHNILYILLIYKKNGIPLFEYQPKISDLNPVLLAGYLGAISSFRDQIMKSPQKELDRGWELNYEHFKISWFNGKLIYLSLLSEKTLSKITRTNIQDLIQDIENVFSKELSHFDGVIEPFKPTFDLMKTHLELELTFPQKLNKEKLKITEKLTKSEVAMINLARIIESESDYFYFKKLITTVASARGESEKEILGITYNLWKQDYFISSKVDSTEKEPKTAVEPKNIPEKDKSVIRQDN